MVVDLFSDIPSNKVPAPGFLHLGHPFQNPSFRKLFRIVPSKNVQRLQLTWSLESLLKKYREKPLTYVATLIGHEGEGSLLALLRKRNWARNIRCGNDESSFELNTTCSLFSILLSLTDEGLNNAMHVITLVFQYIKMLQSEGPQQLLWSEIYHIDHNEFQWQEPQDQQDYVHRIAVDMQRYKPRDYLTGGRIMMEYDEQLIKRCQDQLKPDRMNVAVWSKSFENEISAVSHTEPWYQTTYYVEDLDADWVRRWSDCEKSDDLFLPKANPYIASNFEIKHPDCDISNLDTPISSSTVSRLWYLPDRNFCVPKGYINFYLKSKEADQSARNMCLTDIYAVMLGHLVNAVGYSAEVAHMQYLIQSYHSGITVRLHGFSECLPKLFVTIVDCIAAFHMSDQLYNTVHQDMVDFYDNYLLCPQNFNKELKKTLLETNYFSILKKKEALTRINRDELKAFATAFYNGLFVEGLLQGNLTSKEALQLEDYLIKKLKVKPADNVTTVVQTQITKLPLGCSTCAFMNRNTSDDNTILTNYYQFGQAGLYGEMLNELALVRMEEPCFAELRTKLQLGYDIQIHHRNIYDVVGFWVTICSQASRFTSDFIDVTLESFVQKFNQTVIQKMTLAAFQKLVATVIHSKKLTDTSLKDEVSRHWNEILGKTYKFKRQQLEVNMLKTVKLEELKNWSNEHLTPSVTRRKLSVQVSGHFTSQSTSRRPKKLAKRRRDSLTAMNQPFHKITDVEQFKATCERYSFTQQY